MISFIVLFYVCVCMFSPENEKRWCFRVILYIRIGNDSLLEMFRRDQSCCLFNVTFCSLLERYKRNQRYFGHLVYIYRSGEWWIVYLLHVFK